jgi:hypothetical protein
VKAEYDSLLTVVRWEGRGREREREGGRESQKDDLESIARWL